MKKRAAFWVIISLIIFICYNVVSNHSSFLNAYVNDIFSSNKGTAASPSPNMLSDTISDAAANVTPDAYISIPSYSGLQLVWHDEFAGDQVNDNYWTLQTGSHIWGNNELQYYTDRPENCFVQDGYLMLRALKEDFENCQYTSSRIITKRKVDFLYGKIEIRAKLPIGAGLFPAFWLLPSEDTYDDKRSNGEIDIMEFIGSEPHTIYGVAHYLLNNEYRSWNKLHDKTTDFTKDFHVYSLEWTPQEMKWMIDGNAYYSFDLKSTFYGDYKPFDSKFYLIMNLAVGGDWPGDPPEDTIFPSLVEIDYVRYYK